MPPEPLGLHSTRQRVNYVDCEPERVPFAGRDEVESLRRLYGRHTRNRPGTAVANALEAKYLAHAQRVDQREKERARTRVVGAIDAAVKHRERGPPSHAPLPGNPAPHAPVVIVIGRGILEPVATARHADGPAGLGNERRHYIA